MPAEADRQLPAGGEIFLDHVGHFVRDPDAAEKALVRCGFAPAPKSIQANPDGTPTGTGNVTVMFSRGYLEMLFKTADTPLGREFDAALSGHAGVHLAAFSVADAAAAHARLASAGFSMRPLVQFQRPVGTINGSDIAAFTVVRVERGAMAEGRIQILTHRTEHTVWQPRWLSHPNGAEALIDMVIAAEDVPETAGRFARFTGRGMTTSSLGQQIRLDRGAVQIVSMDRFCDLFPDVAVPSLPFMGAYAVRVHSLRQVERVLGDNGMACRHVGQSLAVPFPEELGLGAWLFVEDADDLLWRKI